MGIPKSHRVDLARLGSDDHGLVLPPAATSTSPANKGFKVLSRPTSHHPSPVLQQRPLEVPSDEPPQCTAVETAPPSAREDTPPSTRNNSGTSTPQRFLTGGASVSNLTTLFGDSGGTETPSTSTDTTERGSVGVRARERHRASLDPVGSLASSAASSSATNTRADGDVDTDERRTSGSILHPTLTKKHSFRGLLMSSLHHGHSHHSSSQDAPPAATTTPSTPSSAHGFAPFPHYTPPSENEMEHLRTTGVPVRRSLDYPSSSTRRPTAAAAGRGGEGYMTRPGMLGRVTRAQSELRYSTKGNGMTTAAAAVRGRPRYGNVAGMSVEEEHRALLDEQLKSPISGGSLSLDEQV
ncbi:hypothetical protein QFC19_007602 [Naganishia cerealis]|uniref:Uncharacterized protein n=1 Tax=Naganishia cerealis TaxID=610337 RepID=A0ACC2V8H4_9TREE|nr:hypothetical protein QFC19_007602 [Naganishia cerealis]